MRDEGPPRRFIRGTHTITYAPSADGRRTGPFRAGVEIECHNCGYTWDYNGDRKIRANCPNCHVNTPIEGHPDSRIGGVDVECPHCGYEWQYSGDHQKWTSCPDCRGHVPIEASG